MKGTNPLDGVADFLAVAEAASFSLAATRLGRSKAAVSDAIARLVLVRLFLALVHRDAAIGLVVRELQQLTPVEHRALDTYFVQ